MELRDQIMGIVDEIGNSEDKLIEILISVQKKSEHHYLSEQSLILIAELLNIPFSKVYGIASFYSMLSTKKRGKYVIQICNSTPCYLYKGKEIVNMFEDILGIKMGEVTQDGLISLEYTSCIGACDQAPAIRVNDRVYGNLDRGKIYKVITSIRRGEL